MKKTLTLFSLVFFLSSVSMAQGWIKIFDGDSLYTPVAYKTSEGGFILSGYKSYYPNPTAGIAENKAGFSLIKTNASGDITWRKQYFTSQAFSTYFDISETSDGGFAIVAATTSEVLLENTVQIPYDEILVAKIDNQGALIWSNSYPISLPISLSSSLIVYQKMAFSCMEDNDGNLLVAAHGNNNIDTPTRPFLLKLEYDCGDEK